MIREKMLSEIKNLPEADIVIIGGGATGLGVAVDAASRGFRTVLIEQSDFAKGTSSRSTKLIHGGLRYLQQGNLALVIEALKERGLLCQNAPHLIHHLPFLVPSYHWWEGPFYGAGLKFYDLLAGKLGIEKSRKLSRCETMKAIPNLEKKHLLGGSIYYDGQFDDARLAIALAKTAVDHGALVVNYVKATSLLKTKGSVSGVLARDIETGRRLKIKAKCVINATGVFTDSILRMDNKKAPKIIEPSQGVHIVLPRRFMPGKTAILVPHTDDGRVIFIVPWLEHLIVGTTDTAVKTASLEPQALKKEVLFLLKHAARYLEKDPMPQDVLSVFTGLRPLVRGKNSKNTAALSRDHTIVISPSGLVTVAGGKWTTYRKMAEDTVDKAILVAHLPERDCITKTLPLHGYKKGIDPSDHFSTYGSDLPRLKAIWQKNKSLKQKLHPRLPYLAAEVVWAVREEEARLIEDVLARRTRALFLDSEAALDAAPFVAYLMAKELGKSSSWEKEQVRSFYKTARHYTI